MESSEKQNEKINGNLTIDNDINKNQTENENSNHKSDNIVNEEEGDQFNEYDISQNHTESIASYLHKERKTLLSRDCKVGINIDSMELKDKILSINPENIFENVLCERTKFLRKKSIGKIMKWQKKEISKPLLEMENIKDQDSATQIFRNLLSYMLDRKSSKEPIFHAKKLLRLVYHSTPIIKDEAYLQIYKQLNENPSEKSFLRGLKMLAMMSSCFVPDNNNIYYVVLQFIYNKISTNKNKEILSNLKYIFNRMLKTSKHERTNVPCREELEFIELLRPIPLTINLFDGTKVSINIEPYTTVKEMKNKIMEKLKISNEYSINYCIYEICTKTTGTKERYIDDCEIVCDIISVWKSEMDKDAENNITSIFKFYLRLLIYYEFDKNDTSTLLRIYYQCVYDVISGRYQLDSLKIKKLASLQIFNEFENDSEKAEEMLNKELDRFIPGNKINDSSKEEWINGIMEKFNQYKNAIDKYDAQWNYLEELKMLQTFNSVQFPAKYNTKKSSTGNFDGIQNNCIIAVKSEGISILDMNLKESVFYDYNIILNWGISKNQFIVTVMNGENENKKICFITSQTKVIQTVIEIYTNMRVGKENKQIEKIMDDYDKKFESIDASKISEYVYKNDLKKAYMTESDNSKNLTQLDNGEEIFKERNEDAISKINMKSSKEKKDHDKSIFKILEKYRTNMK